MNRIPYTADCIEILKDGLPKLIGHWIAAALIILIVAAAAFPFIDRFPPTIDEYTSLLDAGWLSGDTYTVQDVIQSLQIHSPDNTPAYFIVLNYWGIFVPRDIPMARLLSVYASLLALAFMWRLAVDFISPGVGFVAAVLLAGNAYFNWYVIHARMYPLVVLTSCVALWLYLRILFRLTRPKITDYLALTFAVFFFCNLHFFNLIYLAALAGFHIVFAPKNRRWLFTTAAALLALSIFSPYAISSTDALLQKAVAARDASPELQLDAIGGLWYWFNIATNAQPLLLVVPLAGFARVLRHRDKWRLMWLAICGSCLLALATTAQFGTVIVYQTMRYNLAALSITLSCLAAGVFAWRRRVIWLLVFALVCCALGLKWQRSGDWRDLLGNRYNIVDAPPIHVISRIARQTQPPPSYIIYFADWDYRQMLKWGKNRRWSNFEQTQEEYYIKQHGIEIIRFQEVTDGAILPDDSANPIWLVYRTPQMTRAIQSRIDDLMDRLAFKPCDTLHIANDTVIIRYFSDDTTCE